MHQIRKTGSKVVYQNKWMTVREDTIKRQDGSEGIFGAVEKPDFVVIVPVENDHIYLVEQYRYPVAGRYWELPQGSWEHKRDSNPLEIARGELKEETGLIAQRIEYVGHQFLAPGYSNQGYHIYFATEFITSNKELDKEELDLISGSVPLFKFEEMIQSEQIKDATSVNSYHLTKMKGLI
jgi:8-oxo-dGTP pyrophosphatase MutT (NUDIX family)